MAGETETIVEAHHVDADAEQRLALAGFAHQAAQLGELVVLMIENLADLRRRVADNVRHRHAGLHRNPHRQYVRRHARHAPGHVASRRDRQADHHIVGALQTIQEDRSRGAQEPRQIGAGALRRGAKRRDSRTRQLGALADETFE